MAEQFYIGNLTRDIEARTSQSGQVYAFASIAADQGKPREGQEQEPVFLDFTLFKDMARHAAKSLHKGDRVVIRAVPANRRITVTMDGEDKQITQVNFIAREIAPSLMFATAQVTRIQKPSGPKAPAAQPEPVAAADDSDDF